MELFRRVIDIADRFGLGLWVIKVDERPTEHGESDEYAVTNFEGGEARVTFWAPFYALAEHEQLQVIVHELVHIVFAPVDEMIESLPDLGEQFIRTLQKIDPFDDAAARAVYEMFCTQLLQNYEQRAERLVEAVAMMVVNASALGIER